MSKNLRFRVWLGGRYHVYGFMPDGRGNIAFIGVPSTNAEPVPFGEIERRSERSTGFRDADLVEIFEGDYLEHVESRTASKVVLDDMKGWGRELASGHRFFPMFDCLQSIDEPVKNFKVLGTIHTSGISGKL